VIEYGLFIPTPAIFEPPSNRPPVPTFNYTDPVKGLNGRPTSLRAGRAVGGSSTVNGQFFDRGSRFDYDDWEKLYALGGEESDISWSWGGLMPYFKKVSSESFSVRILVEYRSTKLLDRVC
jgi:choline dehydrogenase